MFDDNVMGLEGQMSYYFSLALFPFLIFLAALVGTLPVTGMWARIFNWIIVAVPAESQHFLLETVTGLTRGHRSFLSVGMLGTLWAASLGIMSAMTALNTAYQVKETRSWIHRIVLAMLMVVVLNFFFVIGFSLLSLGDWVDQWPATGMGISAVVVALLRVGRWIVSLVLLAGGVAFANFALPNMRRHWRWITPGAIFVVLAWVCATQTMDLYARYIVTYDKAYGALGAFMILMVWIYLISLITLVGAEINSELWKMRSPAAPPPLPPPESAAPPLAPPAAGAAS